MSPQAFRQLMRMHPAAANIVATGKAPNRTGMTVSAFMSLGVEPPTVVCAINRSALSYAQMAENQYQRKNWTGRIEAVRTVLLADPDLDEDAVNRIMQIIEPTLIAGRNVGRRERTRFAA